MTLAVPGSHMSGMNPGPTWKTAGLGKFPGSNGEREPREDLWARHREFVKPFNGFFVFAVFVLRISLGLALAN